MIAMTTMTIIMSVSDAAIKPVIGDADVDVDGWFPVDVLFSEDSVACCPGFCPTVWFSTVAFGVLDCAIIHVWLNAGLFFTVPHLLLSIHVLFCISLIQLDQSVHVQFSVHGGANPPPPPPPPPPVVC